MPAPLEIESFDPAEWVNEYARPAFSINDATFDQILKFSLIWSIFERFACGRHASWTSFRESVDAAVAKGSVSPKNFEPHIEFFRNRAKSHHDSIDGYVAALRTDSKSMDALLRDFMNNTVLSPAKTITALLLIAYRVRNNLFHGEKEVAYLHTQSELFKVINAMLATYLSLTKSAA